MADPGGELLLRSSTGSALVVATDRMHSQFERCAAVVDFADSALAQLAVVRSTGGATLSVDEAEHWLRSSRSRADEILTLGTLAARGYEQTEQLIAGGRRTAAGLLAGLFGAVARVGVSLGLVALATNPALLGVVVSGLVAGRSTVAGGGADAAAAAGDWLVANPGIITDPAFVRAVGLFVTSSDDFLLGFLGLPPGASLLLGDDGAGLTGLPFATGTVIGAARAIGVLQESDVRVERVRAASVDAPTGSEDRLSRIPDGESQLRVERYEAEGMPPRWIVYVGPTADFALTGDEPFDMTANFHGVAGASPASLRALELALHDAGVSTEDEIHFVGFSQGGLIAARMIESGRWNAIGMESYGAPVGGVDLPAGIAGFNVRHTDDLVPATAGPDGDSELLVVERRAFLPGEPLPQIPAPAHQRESYAATARLIDTAESELLQRQTGRLDSFAAEYLAAGGRAEVFEYRAERITE